MGQGGFFSPPWGAESVLKRPPPLLSFVKTSCRTRGSRGFDAEAELWRSGGVVLQQQLMGTTAQTHGWDDEGTVSLRAEVPESLLVAMRTFIDHHPNWDQYRLVQAALAGFLVQHGSQDRAVTRCYLANLFPGHRRFEDTTSTAARLNQPLPGSQQAA